MSFAGARWQMNTTLHQNRQEDTRNWTNLCLEPYDYWSHYVNIDLRHQYGISVAESQTFLLAKRPQRRRARRNGCFRMLAFSAIIVVSGRHDLPFDARAFPLTSFEMQSALHCCSIRVLGCLIFSKVPAGSE